MCGKSCCYNRSQWLWDKNEVKEEKKTPVSLQFIIGNLKSDSAFHTTPVLSMAQFGEASPRSSGENSVPPNVPKNK